ncbi:MAG TPA: hypothetical protein VK709_13840 [Candidatus Saccharimonadales bacterium]|jgi:hypothetical protein|nr:hypothetical protein [Candidatus Saccharimonadales bacterium]
MTDPGGWIDKWSRRLFSWFSQREVKTPLAFYFRSIGSGTVLIVVALYLVPPDQKLKVFEIGIGTVLAIGLVVAVLAWFRIKNLVYGESGHRAEMKFTLGTEKRDFEPGELATLPGGVNPATLPEIGELVLPTNRAPNALPASGQEQ